MDLFELILNRRSVRKYTGESVSEAALNRILAAGLLAPTGKNKKPCEFYLVRDKELLKELSAAKKAGGAMLADCDAAIAVLADPEVSDTWIEDSSIALSYMQLMAAESGVGSCWCQMRLRSSAEGKDAEANVRAVVDAPPRYRVVGVLALGIPAEQPKPRTERDADFSKVFEL
ncbi:MAG: nitroreductase family protein [Bacillota bacterium]|jgi:nitroreductase